MSGSGLTLLLAPWHARPSLLFRESSISAKEQSSGTVARGAGTCPYSDCGRVIDGDEIKAQAQAGHMGEQLYTVVYKKRIVIETKSGKTREKWVREYRAPHPEDENTTEIQAMLSEKLPEWEALDIVPSERFPAISNKMTAPSNTGCRSGAICFRPVSSFAMAQASKFFVKCSTPTRTQGKLNESTASGVWVPGVVNE